MDKSHINNTLKGVFYIMKKLFVGGYYDDRYFDVEEKTPFNKEINTYTLEEALKLPFVEPVKEWYEETYEKEWDSTTEEEKIKAIENYTEGDEIAGLVYFKTEEAAENYKQNVLKEIEELENQFEYVGKEQDGSGYYHDVYELKK